MSNPIVFTEGMKSEEDFYDEDSTIFIGARTKIEPGVVIYPECVIGNDCIIGTNAVLKSNTVIDDNSIVGTLSCTEGNVLIGKHVTVHSQCHITYGTTIGNNVFIGPMFCSTNTPKISVGEFGYPNTTHDPRLDIIIEDGVRIGAGVMTMPGVTIGEKAFIYAGAIIARDVEPKEVIIGRSPNIGEVKG